MASLTVAAAQVSPVNETEYEARTYKPVSSSVIVGKAVYVDSAGKAALARANAVGTAQCIGVVVVNANGMVVVLQRGSVAGFDLSGLAYGAIVYVSSGTAGDVDGAIITGTGNVVTPLGVVMPMSDSDFTKVLFVCPDLLRAPVAL